MNKEISYEDYMIEKKIAYMRGKNAIRHMDSSHKVDFFNTFTTEELNDLLHCAEYVIATRNRRAPHLEDF